MPAGFDTTFRKVRELVADFRAKGDSQDFDTNCCDGGDCQINALVHDLYALTPDEIKIVEGAAK
jgi:hypothetical protein